MSDKHYPGVVGTGPFKPLCTCGWTADSVSDRVEAWNQANRHDREQMAPLLRLEEGQQLLLLRERNRTQEGAPSWLDVDFALQLFDRARRRSKP